jgi:hypothetical protein
VTADVYTGKHRRDGAPGAPGTPCVQGVQGVPAHRLEQHRGAGDIDV